jgi:hypothetical protein
MITLARPFICPDEYVSQKLNAVDFIDPQESIDIADLHGFWILLMAVANLKSRHSLN